MPKAMYHFAVSEEKNRWLSERMSELEIYEKDIEEKFVRSSGRGGQKVNKTSTCVHLLHVPTGIEVKCMEERSQSLNRFLARRRLLESIEKLRGIASEADLRREKLRRQKLRRRRRSRATPSSGTGKPPSP